MWVRGSLGESFVDVLWQGELLNKFLPKADLIIVVFEYSGGTSGITRYSSLLQLQSFRVIIHRFFFLVLALLSILGSSFFLAVGFYFFDTSFQGLVCFRFPYLLTTPFYHGNVFSQSAA